ncbi:hypothetical protein ACQP2E_34865 [Actinoplanes sp. CA-015351]|uniref:hypothetical protein n=1 Tax=Actinoplanes sp. CA-015351 TaxID=3239897 RepID=UPI003D956792
MAILVAGVAGTLAAGAGLAAWADWNVGGSSGRATARAEQMPEVGKPGVEVPAKGVPRISWTAVTFESGRPVGGYVVTRRIDDKVDAVACTAPTGTLTCSDEQAPAEQKIVYLVNAVAGTRWTGPLSPHSKPVRVGTPSVDAPLAPKVKKKAAVAVPAEEARVETVTTQPTAAAPAETTETTVSPAPIASSPSPAPVTSSPEAITTAPTTAESPSPEAPATTTG